MKRRSFLKGLMAIPAIAAVPVIAESKSVDDPVWFGIDLAVRMMNQTGAAVVSCDDAGIKIESIPPQDIYVNPDGQYGLSVTEHPRVKLAQSELNRTMRNMIDNMRLTN